MVGLGEPVPDAVFIADPVEDVTAEHGLELGVAAAVLGQVGKRHAVVGQDRVQLVGKDLDHLAQEGGTVGFGVGVRKATWANLDTRSIARNMNSLPWAKRSSQTSMCT